VLRIIYTRTSTLGAALIRAMPPWGPWSHCALVLSAGEVIEARAPRGVVRTSLPEIRGRSSAWEMVELDVPDPLMAEAWARGSVGAPYDWGGVIGIPTRRRSLNSASRWYCSEHCAWAVELAGRPILSRGMHGITPTQLWHLTHAAGHRVQGTLT